MANPIKYFFDEHLPDATAVGLVGRGIDVLTADDAGRTGMADLDQLRFATVQGRVMVTHDADYLAIANQFLSAGEPFAGVAYCPPAQYQGNIGGLVRALAKLHSDLSADQMVNHIEYL